MTALHTAVVATMALVMGSSVPQAVEQVSAGLLAASAGLGAHLAVLVLGRVALTIVATRLAGCHAGLENRSGQVGVVAGVTGEDRPGGGADVRAVKVGPHALREHRNHVLAQARICARRARLRALITGLDAGCQPAPVDVTEVLGVRLEHRFDGVHLGLLTRATASNREFDLGTSPVVDHLPINGVGAASWD